MPTLVPRIRHLFDLPDHRRTFADAADSPDIARLLPLPGTITLVTGPSGGGKSQLLRAIRHRFLGRVQWVEPDNVELPDEAVIDCVCSQLQLGGVGEADDIAVVRALELLARVGLAEAWTYLSRPNELSDGERWRLILALMIARASNAASNAAAVIAMDEFAALLDRVTAIVVARSLRKLVRRSPTLAAIVVTSHDDLAQALQPDVTVVCDFGKTRIVRGQDG